jgi:hypothetical protein
MEPRKRGNSTFCWAKCQDCDRVLLTGMWRRDKGFQRVEPLGRGRMALPWSRLCSDCYRIRYREAHPDGERYGDQDEYVLGEISSLLAQVLIERPPIDYVSGLRPEDV